MNRFVINEDQIATLTKIIGNDRVTTILRAHPYDPQIERGVALERLEKIGRSLPDIPIMARCDREALLYITACNVNRLNKIIGDWIRELRRAGEP